MSYDDKIKKLKIILPEAKPPVGNYVATKISGKMLFISGQISIDENGQLIKGKIGKDLETLDWDKTAPGPELPQEVIDNTASKYKNAFKQIAE